jgi:peptide deformylase
VAEFVAYPDPVLTRVAVPRAVDDAMIAAGERLHDAARSVGAHGLAAAHIGLIEPVVVLRLADATSADGYAVLYNPEVLDKDGQPEEGAEGSVSLPGVEVGILRAPQVRIGFDDAHGVRHERTLSGFEARVVQHEIDQMNGIFFLRRLSRLKRERLLKRLGKA